SRSRSSIAHRRQRRSRGGALRDRRTSPHPGTKGRHPMSRTFGKIAQIGYVVTDIHASMDEWVRHGVGPWFYIDNVVTDYFTYRGSDSDMKMSVAIANSGDVQLELIQPRNDAPSAYKDFLDSGRQGAQHIAYWSNNFQDLYDSALAAGYTVAQEGSI